MTEIKHTPELKPCPFCGGEPRHFHTRVKSCVDSNILLDYDFVRCLECASETRQFCDNKEGAITAWNTRAPSAITDNDRLNKALDIARTTQDEVKELDFGNVFWACGVLADHIKPSAITKAEAQEALEEIRRVPLRSYETIRALLEAAAK